MKRRVDCRNTVNGAFRTACMRGGGFGSSYGITCTRFLISAQVGTNLSVCLLNPLQQLNLAEKSLNMNRASNQGSHLTKSSTYVQSMQSQKCFPRLGNSFWSLTQTINREVLQRNASKDVYSAFHRWSVPQNH